MSVRTMLKEWLDQHGYDGLYSPTGGCACERDDLIPCSGEGVEHCEPGYRIECDGCDFDADPHWHMAKKKDAKPGKVMNPW